MATLSLDDGNSGFEMAMSGIEALGKGLSKNRDRKREDEQIAKEEAAAAARKQGIAALGESLVKNWEALGMDSEEHARFTAQMLNSMKDTEIGKAMEQFGNKYIYRNELPKTVEQVAAQAYGTLAKGVMTKDEQMIEKGKRMIVSGMKAVQEYAYAKESGKLGAQDKFGVLKKGGRGGGGNGLGIGGDNPFANLPGAINKLRAQAYELQSKLKGIGIDPDTGDTISSGPGAVRAAQAGTGVEPPKRKLTEREQAMVDTYHNLSRKANNLQQQLVYTEINTRNRMRTAKEEDENPNSLSGSELELFQSMTRGKK